MKSAGVGALGTPLTTREHEILEFLAVGLTNREIAERLALSPRTAENHVDHVLSKLGSTTRARAVIEARRTGLLGAATGGAGSPEGTPANNLPLQVTPLLGREGDLAEVEGLLNLHRLLTVSGSGGIGKTRLALGAGFDLLDRFSHGAWFCDLSTISNPQDVSRAVAKVLAVRERPDQALSESIVSWLKRKHTLLIFDNCEHVVGAAAELSDEILRSCQNVRILATSRQSLGVIGEVIYRVRSLAFPEDTEALNADAAMRYAAIALFVDRARACENRFALTNDNAVIVGKICRRLDGIPLAIELAAARVSVLSVGTLAEKLAKHFRVLSAGDKNAVPRQQTMRALSDWSYEHLSDAEQALLRRLAIFVGGFTLELAGAAHASETIAEESVFDLLASLIDKSLVQTEFGGSAARYRLLETTRQYAREKLDESGEYAAVASAHAVAMLELAESLDADWERTPDRIVFARAEPEFENWRAALDWALRQRSDLRVGQRLAGSLDEMWLRFADVEGWHWIQAAKETVDDMTPSAVLARLELAEAMLCAPLGRYKTSLGAAERAMALYDRLDDPRGLTRAQHYTGRGLVFMGRFAEGEALLRAALQSARAMGAHKLASTVLHTLALERFISGDSSEAREFWIDARALYEATGSEENAAPIALNLAELEFKNGALEMAVRLTREAATVFRAGSRRSGLVHALSNRAAYLSALGRFYEARTSGQEALGLARELGMPLGTMIAMQHLAAVAVLRPNEAASASANDYARGAQLLGFVDRRLSEIEFVRQYTEQQEYDKVIDALNVALGHERLERLMGAGRTWTEEQATLVALEI